MRVSKNDEFLYPTWFYNLNILRITQSIIKKDLQRFMKCIKTGLDNEDSNLGCYAMTPTDYSVFCGFFDLVIRDYHEDSEGTKQHVTSWDILVEDSDYDLKKLGLDKVSMRVRVGRNLIGTNLPGLMNKDERISFEKKMLHAFDVLISKHGGKVLSLSPDFGTKEINPNLISDEEYESLVNDHVLFKDMSADPYLKSAGISSDWPYGRGCWHSEDESKIIWFGEEDQLRIMCMEEGTDLLSPFHDLKDILTDLEAIEGIDFAKDENYGYVTSCPSNLGTGMRASVHIKVPCLTADGKDSNVKIICNNLGLSVRGVGGEHTPVGKDGTVDLSPSSRLFVTEAQIISSLYSGIEQLVGIENKVSEFIKDDTAQSKTYDHKEEDIVDEVRDDGDKKKSVNFVLVQDDERQEIEEQEQNENIQFMKECAKQKSKSMLIKPPSPLLTKKKATRSMSMQSPSALKISPSPVLAIKNE